MARRIETPAESLYRQSRRSAACSRPLSRTRRHPRLWQTKFATSLRVGHGIPRARMPRLFCWRASVTDEEWVSWGALDDDAWYERVRTDFGLDARPKKASQPADA
jgi:hypothetical protein